MTKDEAIYCMQSYLPYDEYEHCTSCPYYGANDVDGQVSVCKSAEAHEMAINALKAEPVRHGKWEMKPDPHGFFDEIPVCSECGCTTKMREKTNFCPHCGARMDAERKEE